MDGNKTVQSFFHGFFDPDISAPAGQTETI
jgi:hypothetical protein